MKKLLLSLLFISATASFTSFAYANGEDTGQYTSAAADTALVKKQLLTQKGIDSADISVQTLTNPDNTKTVILSGTQPTDSQIKLAEKTAKLALKKEPGVTVENKITKKAKN